MTLSRGRRAPDAPPLHVLHPAPSLLDGGLQAGVDAGHNGEVAGQNGWATNHTRRLEVGSGKGAIRQALGSGSDA